MVTATEKTSRIMGVKLPPNDEIRSATAVIRRHWTPEERRWRERLGEARQLWLLRWAGVTGC